MDADGMIITLVFMRFHMLKATELLLPSYLHINLIFLAMFSASRSLTSENGYLHRGQG
jgi:hypothetical protein